MPRRAHNKADLTGQPFGKLKVVREAGSTKDGKVLWECICECGNPEPKVVSTHSLRRGLTTSCGCRQAIHVFMDGKKYTLSELADKLGLSKSGLYMRYKRGLRGVDLLKPPRDCPGDKMRMFRRLSETTGLDLGTIKGRYDRGLRGDDLTRPKTSPREHSGKRFLFRGEWHTISEIAKALGVAHYTVRSRLADGYTEPVDELLKDIGRRTAFGVELTVREIAELSGGHPAAVHNLLRNGRTPEEILTMLRLHRKKQADS